MENYNGHSDTAVSQKILIVRTVFIKTIWFSGTPFLKVDISIVAGMFG